MQVELACSIFNSSDYFLRFKCQFQAITRAGVLPHGAVIKDGNLSQAGAFEFQHRTVTSVEDGLVAWYTFDQINASVIPDIFWKYAQRDY